MEQRRRGALLLAAGLNQAEQRRLRAGADGGAVAAPHFAGDHHRPDRLFGPPVGGLQAGTAHESEDGAAFAAEVAGQPKVRVKATQSCGREAAMVKWRDGREAELGGEAGGGAGV